MDDTPKLLADSAASLHIMLSDDKIMMHAQYLDDPTRFATVVLSPAAFVRLREKYYVWLVEHGYTEASNAVRNTDEM